MKAEDIYDKALAEYPIKEKLNKKAVGTYDANYPRRKAFVAGAEWMQEEMIENPDGGALLYAVVKTAERTKREMIEKAAEWFEKYLFDIGYPDDWCRDSLNLISGKDRFIKAMQDETSQRL